MANNSNHTFAVDMTIEVESINSPSKFPSIASKSIFSMLKDIATPDVFIENKKQQ